MKLAAISVPENLDPATREIVVARSTIFRSQLQANDDDRCRSRRHRSYYRAGADWQTRQELMPMKEKIRGLHHVTAIATDPQRNLDFYVGLLGLRFVKRTVNFDDPGSYHFYFGDNRGHAGHGPDIFSLARGAARLAWHRPDRSDRVCDFTELDRLLARTFQTTSRPGRKNFSIWRGRSSLDRSGWTSSRANRCQFSPTG